MRPKTAVRAAFLLLAVSLLVVAVVREGDAILVSFGRLSPLGVAGSALLVLAALAAQMLSWRALFHGSDAEHLTIRAAGRIYFLGQLGKYVPGSVWAVVAQAELGKDHRVARTQSAVVALGALVVLTVTGSVVGAAGLLVGSVEALTTYWWALLAIPVGAVALWPAVVNRLVLLALRISRRGSSAPALTGTGLLRSALWAVVQWLLFGAHAWLLAIDLGASGPADAATVVGAFALAWVVGFVVVIAPAGAGPREAALVLGLAPVMAAPEGLVLALVSRVLMMVGDGVLAAAFARPRTSHVTSAPVEDAT
ncbi:MAG TPA: lysylphosphatidylglycerol synthase domain-containing protein [Pengzhenrongella sp.]